MATILKIPKVAVSMQEGILTSWLVGDGESVMEGQPMYTLELEKSTLDIAAPAAGILRHKGTAGTTYKVGEQIGAIESMQRSETPAEVVIAPGSIYHTGYVVADIHAAVRHWVEQVGAGPFVLFEKLQLVSPIYRGQPTLLDLTVGFAYSGDSCIELIEPHSGAPNIYTEIKGALHHIGVSVPDLNAAVHRYADAGVSCLFRAGFEFGGGCAYLDTADTLGVFTELVEVGTVAQSMLAQIRAAHRSWNRRDYTFTLS